MSQIKINNLIDTNISDLNGDRANNVNGGHGHKPCGIGFGRRRPCTVTVSAPVISVPAPAVLVPSFNVATPVLTTVTSGETGSSSVSAEGSGATATTTDGGSIAITSGATH
jgi:hypothetical protein